MSCAAACLYDKQYAKKLHGEATLKVKIRFGGTGHIHLNGSPCFAYPMTTLWLAWAEYLVNFYVVGKVI